MRRLALVPALLVLVGCGAGARPASEDEGRMRQRYGITIAVPAGWHAELTRGVVRLAGTQLKVELYESQVGPNLPAREAETFFERVARPPLLQPDDFGAPESGTSVHVDHGFARHAFSLAGRFFVLFAESETRPPEREALAALNAALQSLQVEPGDFYDGMVEPATFRSRAGWYTGTDGAAPIQAQGESTWSWAATIPWADPPRSQASETLRRLPPNGIAITVWLDRSSRGWPRRPLDFSLRLEQFERRDMWEGEVGDIPEYVLGGTVRDYHVEVRVYFGREHPAPAMLAEAEAMLDGLRLPDWGPWEVD